MSHYPVTFKKNWIGQWYWRIKASNGRVIARSTESFFNRKDCVNNARITLNSLVHSEANQPS